MFLLILQWIVSLIAVGCICYVYHVAFLENKLLAIIGIVLMPIFLPVFLVMHWKKYNLKYALIIFLLGFLFAACLQRARLGFWDWPDVDYKMPAERENEID